jgi:inosose dehydratase
MAIKFGCQTYTWQMSYEKYSDSLVEILDSIQAAGFSGVEAEVCMLGGFYDDHGLLKEALLARGLELAALTLALPWLNPEETEEEKAEADRLIAYLGHFPEARLILVQHPGTDRSNLAQRQNHTLNCVNAVAKRANAQGMICAYHPNSPSGSVFRTAEDYAVMFAGLDERYVGYCPDSGHIANGDMDAPALFREKGSLIRHVHFKDISADKQWRTMGEGVLDHPGIVEYLQEIGYDGWIMVEEESEMAEKEPDRATMLNGKYVLEVLHERARA